MSKSGLTTISIHHYWVTRACIGERIVDVVGFKGGLSLVVSGLGEARTEHRPDTVK